MIQAHPLQWPAGWPRTNSGEVGRFKSGSTPITVWFACGRVIRELERMGVPASEIVISTNIPLRRDGTPRSDQGQPADKGAAVYWNARTGRAPKVMAIDLYNKVEQNIAALAATLEAMRAIERHGGAQILERAFTGFTSLAAPDAFDPWAILGLKPGADRGEVERKFRELAMRHHPDMGGDAAEFHRIQKAREKCLEAAP